MCELNFLDKYKLKYRNNILILFFTASNDSGHAMIQKKKKRERKLSNL